MVQGNWPSPRKGRAVVEYLKNTLVIVAGVFAYRLVLEIIKYKMSSKTPQDVTPLLEMSAPYICLNPVGVNQKGETPLFLAIPQGVKQELNKTIKDSNGNTINLSGFIESIKCSGPARDRGRFKFQLTGDAPSILSEYGVDLTGLETYSNFSTLYIQ